MLLLTCLAQRGGLPPGPTVPVLQEACQGKDRARTSRPPPCIVGLPERRGLKVFTTTTWLGRVPISHLP